MREPGRWNELDGEHPSVDLLGLPFPKLLNIIYRALVVRLPPREENQPDPRDELDATLEVMSWPMPSFGIRYERVEGAPAWWRGDEEASEAFIAAMGVSLG